MRIAAIDLGSNSFHMLIVDAHPDGSFDTLLREKEVLRLGDVVAASGRIGEEHAARVIEAMRRMATVIRTVGADEVVACATSAFREADDSGAVCDAIFDETGISVEVISGRREARLIFGAVRRSIAITRPPAVCIDLGGGSLELSVGDAGGLLWSTSLRLGVGRLATMFLGDDPPREGDLQRLRDHVVGVLTPVVEEVRTFEPKMLIGSSGSFCDLAAVADSLRSGKVPASVNQLTVRRRELTEAHEKIISMTASERAKLPGLESRRADQIPAGSVVLQVLMELLAMNELTVSDWALREGILIEAIERRDVADWSDDPEAVRRASVDALARRCNYDSAHASAVARLATDLFDQTLTIHRLGQQSRSLLEYGAVLHDIGEHVAVDGHQKHSAYLIAHGQLRGFEPFEIDMLATMGRYHRRSRPGSSFEPWRRLERHRRDETLELLALLRVADGLDRGRLGVVEGIDVEISDEAVRVVITASGEADLELWGVRRKRELFEDVFGRRLELVAPDRPPVPGGVPRQSRTA